MVAAFAPPPMIMTNAMAAPVMAYFRVIICPPSSQT